MTITAETTGMPGQAPVEDLVAELARKRDLAAAKRADELARLRAEADHKRALADLAESERRADLDRDQREGSATADAALERLRRETRAEGVRIKTAVTMARTVEARSKELAGLSRLNLKVLVPLFVIAGALSATGVHDGAARIMRISDGDSYWWALWGLEPLLLGIAGFTIYLRGRLTAAGGTLDVRAERGMFVCLGLSVVLNIAAATWPDGEWDRAAVGVLAATAMAHALAPVGAAFVAWLIGVNGKSITDTDPYRSGAWKQMPGLDDLFPETFPAVVLDPVDAEPSPAPVEQPAEGTDTDTDELIEELFARSVKTFADDLFGGRIPGIRAIKSELKVGQPRAQEVQTYLADLVRI